MREAALGHPAAAADSVVHPECCTPEANLKMLDAVSEIMKSVIQHLPVLNKFFDDNDLFFHLHSVF
jgi:hypothetical protein